jgi:hypothetical protein
VTHKAEDLRQKACRTQKNCIKQPACTSPPGRGKKAPRIVDASRGGLYVPVAFALSGYNPVDFIDPSDPQSGTLAPEGMPYSKKLQQQPANTSPPGRGRKAPRIVGATRGGLYVTVSLALSGSIPVDFIDTSDPQKRNTKGITPPFMAVCSWR